jgi:glycine oxidase
VEANRPDAFVIGAGIIGASIAWKLAQAGARVVLADAGRMGGEASSAGAGMLAPGGEFERDSIWAKLGTESISLYPAYVRALEADSGLQIDFRICGAIDVANTEEEQAAAVARATKQTPLGIRSNVIENGICYPDDGYVDPVDVLKALRVACEKHGVELRENSAIQEMDVTTAGAVVLAAGARSDRVRLTYRGRRIGLDACVPVKGYLLGYRLEPGSLGPIRRRGHTYLLQRANGFTIAGSTEERDSFDRAIDPAICHDLHARAAALWPRLASAQPDESWIGFRPATVSGLPAIGRIGETNLWTAYGHYRNGILLAPVTAERVAAEIIASLGKG